MSEMTDAEAAVRERMRSTAAPPARLELEAATPLETLPPEIVALVVGRARAGLSPLGGEHPRASLTQRVVVPSASLAVLDLVGLIVAAAGKSVLVVIAAVLLVVLAYIAYSGWRYVRLDPLRVTAAQRAYVDHAKQWRTKQTWTDEQRAGPWARLVTAARDAVDRIAMSDAWTWASIAGHRAAIELGATLDGINATAHQHAQSGNDADDGLVRRAAALHSLADALDDLVRRDQRGEQVRDALPAADEARLGEMVSAARSG